MLICSFVHSYLYVNIYSLLFVCEHLFTFQFCALMPKISKENFAIFLIRKTRKLSVFCGFKKASFLVVKNSVKNFGKKIQLLYIKLHLETTGGQIYS